MTRRKGAEEKRLLAELFDLLNLAGELGGEGLLQRLQSGLSETRPGSMDGSERT